MKESINKKYHVLLAKLEEIQSGTNRGRSALAKRKAEGLKIYAGIVGSDSLQVQQYIKEIKEDLNIKEN